MARTVMYTFKLNDGSVKIMTRSEAEKEIINHPEIEQRLNEILRNTTNIRRVRDGFQAGFQPALGEVVTCPGKYREILKERNLVEIGNEKPTQFNPDMKNYIDGEIIKQAIDSGANISGQEAAALESGTYKSEAG